MRSCLTGVVARVGAQDRPTGRRSRAGAAAVVVAITLALVGLGPVSAQTGGDTVPAPPPDQAPPTEPAPAPDGGAVPEPAPEPPLVAQFAPRGTIPELAIESLWVDAGADDDGGDEGTDDSQVVVLSFSRPFPLPADGYRASVLFGDPAAEQIRASLVVAGGAPTGLLERGDGTTWESLGETGVEFTGAGEIRIAVPSALVSEREAVWGDVALAGDTGLSGTPLFRWTELRGDGDPGVLVVSPFAKITDAQLQPSGEIVRVDDGPSIEVVNGNVIVSFAAPPPPEVVGAPVVGTIDYVRLGPEAEKGGLPRYYVGIDHARGDVVLWDATPGIPRPVTVDPATWLVQGFDPSGENSEIVLSLAGLNQAVGVAPEEASYDLGLARVLVLADGRLASFEAVTGSVTWFVESAAATVPPIEDDLAALESDETPASDDADGGGTAWIWPVLALLIVAAVIAGLVVARRRRPDPSPADEAASEQQPELVGAMAGVAASGVTDDHGRVPSSADDRSSADDPQPTPAAPSRITPDEALAALRRTVGEVTAGLDAADAPVVTVASDDVSPGPEPDPEDSSD